MRAARAIFQKKKLPKVSLAEQVVKKCCET
nr:MAG TPA: hypothetical protein [Caudoviricetes sp.]